MNVLGTPYGGRLPGEQDYRQLDDIYDELYNLERTGMSSPSTASSTLVDNSPAKKSKSTGPTAASQSSSRINWFLTILSVLLCITSILLGVFYHSQSERVKTLDAETRNLKHKASQLESHLQQLQSHVPNPKIVSEVEHWYAVTNWAKPALGAKVLRKLTTQPSLGFKSNMLTSSLLKLFNVKFALKMDPNLLISSYDYRFCWPVSEGSTVGIALGEAINITKVTMHVDSACEVAVYAEEWRADSTISQDFIRLGYAHIGPDDREVNLEVSSELQKTHSGWGIVFIRFLSASEPHTCLNEIQVLGSRVGPLLG